MVDLPVEIEMMTAEEAEQIFHQNKKRAGNFAKFIELMNKKDVGDAWTIWIDRVARDNGLDTDDYAKTSRYNWNEAAAKRTKLYAVEDDDVITHEHDGEMPTFTLKGTDEAVRLIDGAYKVERAAPVKLTWKTVSHDAQREVTDDNGRKGTVKVTIIDAYKVEVGATKPVVHRARVAREDVTALVVAVNATPSTTVGDTFTLTDGRTAKLGKNAKWTAPKVTTSSVTDSAPAPSTTTDTSTSVSNPDASASSTTDGTDSSSTIPTVQNGTVEEPELASVGTPRATRRR